MYERVPDNAFGHPQEDCEDKVYKQECKTFLRWSRIDQEEVEALKGIF